MRRIFVAMCLAVLCVILTAGLWPFNFFPKNKVSWLADGNGLQFRENARVHSSGLFEAPDPKKYSFCSLELWVRPSVTYLKGPATILLFTAPDNPLQFRVRQGLDVLLLRRDTRDGQNHVQTIPVDIERSFRQDEQVFLTITAGPQGTSVYRDGAFLNVFPRFGLSCKDFSGELILGGTLTSYRTWPGRIFGVAFYEQELSPEKVARHYAMWTQKAAPEDFIKDGLLALYPFSEHNGQVAHNTVAATPNLFIPRIFRVPRKKMLALPWEEFTPDLSYVFGLLENVAGFVPLGFFLFAYLNWGRPRNRAAIITVVLGAILSLSIEILQEFLISRMSGITDIITNTLGTGLGVALWSWEPVQLFVAKLGTPKSNGDTSREIR